MATDCCPESMSQSLRRMVLESVGSAEPPVHAKRPCSCRKPTLLSCISWQHALRSSPRSGQCDNLGAGEVTVLDLQDTEGPMRLAPFVGG